MKYTFIVTFWIIFILTATNNNYVLPAICAGVHLLGLIGYELQEMSKQRKESSEQLIRTLEAIALQKQ